MLQRYWGFAAAVLLLASCKPARQSQAPTDPAPVTVAPAVPRPATKQSTYPYRPSIDKAFDLIHTRLEVDFDWAKERMDGTAQLTLRPWFASQKDIVLDAKGFIIHEVGMTSGTLQLSLQYQYDNERLTIHLDRSYTRDETLKVNIRYTARPHELDSLISEEAAEDQGLYFVNAGGEVPGKPRQIWTQGESHGSPGWFPTFDSPNQRCTSEIFITVEDSFKTLSNGLLVESMPKPGGLRTDHWVMELPHAPYLFMMAIGPYAIVKDQWRGREVSYYVEPKYAPYARLIFGNTPEMMEFFSQKLGVDYPWPKYGQVVVRDFVSGAMENTSATTHFERLQHDARQHLENTYEDIVSHELFHQWFGDLVTCESWANLSLNEGFATYGEYLWMEYKYGHDDATVHLMQDRATYLRSATRQKLPIIRYHHRNSEAMFDAHSYQKGGQVLHMLRKQVGDEAFFASLKRYLTQNAYDDVEIHELRLAFEEVTGQDLNWFFNQWYLAAGHPELKITHAYGGGKYSLHVEQVQDMSMSPVFRLPLTVEFWTKGKAQQVQVWMEDADTTFEFEAASRPDMVIVDPERDLLLQVKEEIHPAEGVWLQQAFSTQDYARKSLALERMDVDGLADADFKRLMALGKDGFWGTRELLLDRVAVAGASTKPDAIQLCLDMLGDPKAPIRINAVIALHGNLGSLPESMRAAAGEALLRGIQDSSYTVSQFSLETYCNLEPEKGMARIREMMLQPEPHLLGMIAKVLKDSESPEALPFIRQHLENPRTEGGAKIAMLRGLGDYLNKRPEAERQEGTALMMQVFRARNSRWLRLTALQALSDLDATDEIKAFIEEANEAEQDPMIKNSLQRYLNTH
jgi:aminopeptidase N